MHLDLRLAIGVLFSLYGLLLVGFGLFSNEAIYRRSLGINLNLWWGLVLLVFGILMLGFAIRARAREREARESS